jgi:hypothetical protein
MDVDGAVVEDAVDAGGRGRDDGEGHGVGGGGNSRGEDGDAGGGCGDADGGYGDAGGCGDSQIQERGHDQDVEWGEDSYNADEEDGEDDDGEDKDTHGYGAAVKAEKYKRCEEKRGGEISKAKHTAIQKLKAARAEKKLAVEKNEKRRVVKAKKVELRERVNMLRMDSDADPPAYPKRKKISDGTEMPDASEG